MKSEYIFLVLVILLTLTNCNNSNYNVIVIKPYKTIARFGDSTYFSNITSIQVTDSAYYFSDMVNSRIVKTNKDLEYLSSLGSYGEGPNEYVEVAEIFVSNNQLYAFDGGILRLNYYKNNTWEKHVKVPYFGPFLERFYVQDDTLIVNSSRLDNSFLYKFDLVGNIVSVYNFLDQSFWNSQKVIRSPTHVLTAKNKNTIVVPLDEPRIFMVDSLWESHKVIGFENNAVLLNQIAHMQEEYYSLSSNTTSILFEDAFIDEINNLYILTYHLDQKNERHYNILMKFCIVANDILYRKSYRLQEKKNGNWYNSIAIRNDTLVAFEFEYGEIHLFSLVN